MTPKIKSGLTKAIEFLQAAKNATTADTFAAELEKARDLITQFEKFANGEALRKEADQAVTDALEAYKK